MGGGIRLINIGGSNGVPTPFRGMEVMMTRSVVDLFLKTQLRKVWWLCCM